jgi:hypothetical protein
MCALEAILILFICFFIADMLICCAIKKDGQPCTMLVNATTSQQQYCQHHKQFYEKNKKHIQHSSLSMKQKVKNSPVPLSNPTKFNNPRPFNTSSQIPPTFNASKPLNLSNPSNNPSKHPSNHLSNRTSNNPSDHPSNHPSNPPNHPPSHPFNIPSNITPSNASNTTATKHTTINSTTHPNILSGERKLEENKTHTAVALQSNVNPPSSTGSSPLALLLHCVKHNVSMDTLQFPFFFFFFLGVNLPFFDFSTFVRSIFRFVRLRLHFDFYHAHTRQEKAHSVHITKLITQNPNISSKTPQLITKPISHNNFTILDKIPRPIVITPSPYRSKRMKTDLTNVPCTSQSEQAAAQPVLGRGYPNN